MSDTPNFSDHKAWVLSLCRTCSKRLRSASFGTPNISVPFYATERYIECPVICLGSGFGRHFFRSYSSFTVAKQAQVSVFPTPSICLILSMTSEPMLSID